MFVTNLARNYSLQALFFTIKLSIAELLEQLGFTQVLYT